MTAQVQGTTAAVREAYLALGAVAVREKRAEAMHRQNAREARRAQARLALVCAELGIKLMLTEPPLVTRDWGDLDHG